MNKKDIEGTYGDYIVSISNSGNLVIKCKDETVRDDLAEIVMDNGVAAAELEVLDAILEGGYIYFVSPEEIGALTDANILAAGLFLNEDGEFLNAEYMWSDINYYQLRSFVDDLIDIGYCVFFDA